MTNTGNEMATPSSQLAKSRVTDSSKDYTDLLAEMGIQPNAQEQVFTIIKRFRDKPNNLIRIRAGTDGGRRYINTILFGKNMMKEFAVVAKGISSPFRDLFDGDKRVAALPM